MFKRIFWFILGALAVLIGLFFLGGKFADVKYSGSCYEIVNAPVEDVWTMMSNHDKTENARNGEFLEMMNGEFSGLQALKQYTHVGEAVPLEIINQSPLEFIEVKMDDNGFGITGTWKYEFEDQGDKTKVTVTENSVTEGLFMRSLLNLLGRDSNMDLHLKAIKKSAENI